MDYSNNECFMTNRDSINLYYIFKTSVFFQILYFIYSISLNLIFRYISKQTVYDITELGGLSCGLLIGNYILLTNTFIFAICSFIILIPHIIYNMLLVLNMHYMLDNIHRTILDSLHKNTQKNIIETNTIYKKLFNTDICILKYYTENNQEIIYNNIGLICSIYFFNNI